MRPLKHSGDRREGCVSGKLRASAPRRAARIRCRPQLASGSIESTQSPPLDGPPGVIRLTSMFRLVSQHRAPSYAPHYTHMWSPKRSATADPPDGFDTRIVYLHRAVRGH